MDHLSPSLPVILALGNVDDSIAVAGPREEWIGYVAQGKIQALPIAGMAICIEGGEIDGPSAARLDRMVNQRSRGCGLGISEVAILDESQLAGSLAVFYGKEVQRGLSHLLTANGEVAPVSRPIQEPELF